MKEDRLSLRITLPQEEFLSRPLDVVPGITAVTGINNVGKTRLLKRLFHIHAWWMQAGSMNAAHFFPLTVEFTKGPLRMSLTVTPDDAERWSFFQRTVHGQVEGECVGQRNTGNPDRFDVRRSDGDVRGYMGGAVSLKALTMELGKELDAVMSNFIYVPPQRTVAAETQIRRDLIPNPDGSNLACALVTYRNDKDSRFVEMQSIMRIMFPEIEDILTTISGLNTTRLMVQDRFLDRSVPLSDCGTGVAQTLHLLALIYFSPPGRLFLIDEPHVYLHASAERALAQVIRNHPEHHYVIATHSPVLIDALNPDQVWLVMRDKRGSSIQSLFPENVNERQMAFTLLGWNPSQFAWADHILFVEGDSDEKVWQVWFRLWGWDRPDIRCAVVPLTGSLTKPLQSVIDELSHWLSVEMQVVLDGDQREKVKGARVDFLPAPEIENILIRDVRSVRQVLLVANSAMSETRRHALAEEWTEEKIQEYFLKHGDPKGSKQLTDLMWQWGGTYQKTVHNRLIAEQMNPKTLDDIRELVERFVCS